MRHFKSFSLLCALCFAARSFCAEDSYASHLRSAGGLIRQQEYGAATEAFDRAFLLATTDTERALAIVKRAHMQAVQMKDYAGARESIAAASTYRNIEPVAMVTLLEVRSECEMRLDGNKDAAARTLEEAAALKGVDWAMPGIQMKLGDVYRTSGRPQEAIAAYGKVLSFPDIGEGTRAVAHLNLGLTYQYNLRDHAKAREEYERALLSDSGLESEVASHRERMNQ